METKRVLFIEIAKGIGILLVVLGHAIIPQMRMDSAAFDGVFDFIYSFHMPLFVALSGYLYEKNQKKYHEQGFRRFFASKFRVLMVPYLTFSILSYTGIYLAFSFPALADILSAEGYQRFPLPQAAFQILTNVDHLDKHMWFIYALFLIFLASYLLRDIAKKPWFLLIVYIVYFFLPQKDLPDIVVRTVLYMIYFNLARHVSVIDKWAKKERILPAACLFIALFAITRIDVLLVKKFLAIPTAVAGCLTVVAISAAIEKTRAAKPLIFIGSYSYDIYLIHQPFLVSGLGGVLLMIDNLPHLAACLIVFLTGVFVPVVISKYALRRFRWMRTLFLGGH